MVGSGYMETEFRVQRIHGYKYSSLLGSSVSIHPHPKLRDHSGKNGRAGGLDRAAKLCLLNRQWVLHSTTMVACARPALV